MTIIDRIKQIIEYLDIPVSRFCNEVGVANGFFDKVKSVGSDKILKILKRYPEISAEWLITGEGMMLKNIPEETPPVTNVTLIDNDFYINIINDQSKLIKLLEEKIDELETDKNQRTGYDVAASPE